MPRRSTSKNTTKAMGYNSPKYIHGHQTMSLAFADRDYRRSGVPAAVADEDCCRSTRRSGSDWTKNDPGVKPGDRIHFRAA